MDFAMLTNFNTAIRRKRVDNRCTHAMQTAGDFVNAVVEFSTGMKNGHHNFKSCTPFGVDINRNTTGIVGNSYAAIDVQCDLDGVAVARKILVNTVVNEFVYEVMQTIDRRVTDVHSWTFTDSFQTLKNLNLARAVLGSVIGQHCMLGMREKKHIRKILCLPVFGSADESSLESAFQKVKYTLKSTFSQSPLPNDQKRVGTSK
jgi:hypothetical protein